MSFITAIQAIARKPGRFSIVVDGEVAATLSVDAIERLGLSIGKSIMGLEERLAAESAILAVHDRALNMLAFRARSSSELAKGLVRKGEPRDVVDLAITRLTEQGLLDDSAFAQSFARNKAIGAKQSRRRVQQGLAKKGVPRETSEAAITAVFEEEGIDQAELALQAARKKMKSLAKLEPDVRKRRLYGFLARRGFTPDEIRAAMKAELHGEADPAE